MTALQPKRSIAGEDELNRLIQEYHQNALVIAGARRASEQDGRDRTRDIEGLELANKWILGDVMGFNSHTIDHVRTKLELWRLMVLGPHGDTPTTPEQELITTVQEELARLSVEQSKAK